MGLDLTYQAIPLDCEVMQRALRDFTFAGYLAWFHTCAVDDRYSAWAGRAQEDSIFGEFLREARQTVQQYPGIGDRYFYGGRSWWQVLYYLLSPHYRSGKFTTNSDWEANPDLMWRAIYGGDIIDKTVMAGQGVPLHYMMPDKVIEVAQTLAPITRDDLHRHYDPPQMLKHNVIPLREDSDFDAWFESVADTFEKLKNFYAIAAQHREGVLTVMD